MNSNKIALIDDDEIFLVLTKKLLEKKIPDYEFMCFNDSKEAFRFLTSDQYTSDLPSIIFLDIVMPGFGGWRFLQQFEKARTHEYQPHIFLMSGNEYVDHERIKMFPLINGYLIKPVSPDNLVMMIESVSV